ncbi:LEM domain-containing protein 1 [Rattus rattus]|uniref:LEM domain-containing protein 1 n=1 Tax=Rattus rattus TaxID=10117 RepID=UPI0013F2C2AD|nr:LEM domain-containing protein 1 [Rattus rattus]
MVDVKCLSDHELHKHLKTLGFTPGPILPSTRKIYERKLVQLLASPPCESVMKRPRRLPGSEDSDDSEDPSVDIILKGNIKFSKNKEGKKRLEASTNKRRILDIYYLSQKPTKKVRCAARPSPRNKRRYITDCSQCVTAYNQCSESSFLDQYPRNYCLSQNPESSEPWGLKLAILGIFFIVLFVYIIVEKKPLFG